jgi:hypothetical protein
MKCRVVFHPRFDSRAGLCLAVHGDGPKRVNSAGKKEGLRTGNGSVTNITDLDPGSPKLSS